MDIEIIETHIIYDLNWIHIRRKLITINRYLNLCFQYPIIIYYLHLKIIWYKYCIWFNEKVNHGR